MTHKLSVIRCVVVCLLAVTAAMKPAQAKSHDVSPGMRIEDAMLVVKRCIIEATAFKDPRDRLFHRELRAQDTLEYAGITDDARLNALRRYIVRNTDIGVQSIWGVRPGESIAYPYLIPNSALANIKKKQKIEELAREVIKSSGLPYLPHAKAAQIIANCRHLARPPHGKGDTPDMDQAISTDIVNPDQREAFRRCLLFDSTFGIGTAGILDGRGDFYPYLATSFIMTVQRYIEFDTYENLVRHLRNEARVILSSELSSAVIVRNWFLGAHGECKEVSFPIETFCLKQSLRQEPMRPFDTQTVNSLRPQFLKQAIPSTTLGQFRRDEESTPAPVPDLADISIRDDKTIRALTDDVKNKLEGKQ